MRKTPPLPRWGTYLKREFKLRPVHLIITMIKWIRTSRLSITLSGGVHARGGARLAGGLERAGTGDRAEEVKRRDRGAHLVEG